MEERLYNSVKPLIDYNISIRKYILDICKPLFKNFNITYFEYDQISEEGKIFYICTSKDWLEFSLEHKMFDDKEHVKLCSTARKCNYRYALWNYLNLEKTHLLSKYYEYDIWNGFSINEIEGNNLNIYSFATTRKNSELNDFFINNLKLFDHFVIYFKQKLKFLNRDHLSPYISGTPLIKDLGEINLQYHNIETFLEQTKIKTFEIDINEKKLYLTKKEILCLHMLSSGKTMKEIGHKLGISPRTVESHLNVIKAKTGLMFKNQLISFFENNPISSSYLFQKIR